MVARLIERAQLAHRIEQQYRGARSASDGEAGAGQLASLDERKLRCFQ